MHRTLSDMGFGSSRTEEFVYALSHSGSSSVDAFLEHRTDFMDIGKAAIAAALIPFENEIALHALNDSGPSWLAMLFNRMSVHPDKWGNNKLSVITFNYDRSFEQFFLEALQNAFNLPPATAADLLRSTVDIIHVHGRLGALPLLDGGGIRPYTTNVTEGTVRVAASAIQVISEKDPNADVFSRAKGLVSGAEEIVCLGFGYHSTNMERIGLTTLSTFNCWGSTYGMTEAERQRVNRQMSNRIKLDADGWDARNFLRNHHVLGM